MTRNKTMERFFDDADFTNSHDKIFTHLLAHWVDYVLPLVKDKEFHTEIRGSIKGEPALNGYPPLFPDAIAKGRVYVDHRAFPVVAATVHVEDYDQHVTIRCAKCDREERHDLEPKLIKPSEPFFYPSVPVKEREEKMKEYDLEVAQWNIQVRDLQEFWQKPRYWKDLCYAFEFEVLFEIKPNRESAGRILRQLNIYRERLRWKDFDPYRKIILITPDSRFDEMFRSQRVIPLRPLQTEKQDEQEISVNRS